MAILCPHCDTWSVILDDGNTLCCGRNPKITGEEYQKMRKVKDSIKQNPKTYGTSIDYVVARRNKEELNGKTRRD